MFPGERVSSAPRLSLHRELLLRPEFTRATARLFGEFQKTDDNPRIEESGPLLSIMQSELSVAGVRFETIRVHLIPNLAVALGPGVLIRGGSYWAYTLDPGHKPFLDELEEKIWREDAKGIISLPEIKYLGVDWKILVIVNQEALNSLVNSVHHSTVPGSESQSDVL